MNSIQNISIEDYSYDLPDEKIARYPLEQRDLSRLLVYNDNRVEKDVFQHLHRYLPSNSLMVFNNTRVVQARLLFRKPTGAFVEIFCLEPAGEVKDIQLAFQQTHRSKWFCLVGNAKKWKDGPLVLEGSNDLVLKAEKKGPLKDGYIVEFEWEEKGLTFAEVLDIAGKTPLPPYIKRKAETEDKQRYQTIFARHSGSVAAPTAGLHFSEKVLTSLEEKNIDATRLTLHVGAGTFKPVTDKTIANHIMHNEQVVVQKETLEKLLQYAGENIISVGTTSMRTLESIYWLGVKLLKGEKVNPKAFVIEQWEPYSIPVEEHPDVATAIEGILDYMNQAETNTLQGETSLMIVPGYRVKMANILVTNFHQPRSTLLLLVAAFCGEGWRKAYDFALENNFRFLSYGDSCLFFKQPV